MKRLKLKWRIFFFVLTLIYVSSTHSAFADKIIDPYDPRFKPDSFKFEDYTVNLCVEKEIMAKLFPVGTKKSFVDRILVDSGGADIEAETNTPNKFNYFYKPKTFWAEFVPSEWTIFVSYDEDNKVIAISIPSGMSHRGDVYSFFQDCKFNEQYGGNWK